jgi:hypothetical protein
MKKKMFTLVEITLALGVAAVGIIGVMALFPAGLAKNKETISIRSASDSADQFLHIMAAKLRKDWRYKNTFPDTISVVDETNIVWSEQDILPDSNIVLKFSSINSSDNFNYVDHTDGVFFTQQITPGNHIDFEGVIRSWKVLDITEDQRLNGDIMPWGVLDASGGSDDVGYGFTNGEVYSIKNSSHGQVSPGNFGCINFAGGGGAAGYLGFIESGGIEATIGDTFPPLTGNMVGPTISGVTSRLENTPYILIPVVSSFPNGANGVVTIVNFLPFKLIGVSGQGNSTSEVKAIYMGSDQNGVTVNNIVGEKITIKAEVSYPASLEYHLRKKEIFSLTLFRGGNLEFYYNN